MRGGAPSPPSRLPAGLLRPLPAAGLAPPLPLLLVGEGAASLPPLLVVGSSSPPAPLPSRLLLRQESRGDRHTRGFGASAGAVHLHALGRGRGAVMAPPLVAPLAPAPWNGREDSKDTMPSVGGLGARPCWRRQGPRRCEAVGSARQAEALPAAVAGQQEVQRGTEAQTPA
jgi:hypothetical protein